MYVRSPALPIAGPEVILMNTAMMVLMAPICFSIAQEMGADPKAVLIACVIGGSYTYATPIGMPANTMVLGVGGYKFTDYVKSGLPLMLIGRITHISYVRTSDIDTYYITGQKSYPPKGCKKSIEEFKTG